MKVMPETEAEEILKEGKPYQLARQMAEILCEGLSGCDQSDPVQFLDDNGITVGMDPNKLPPDGCGQSIGQRQVLR